MSFQTKTPSFALILKLGCCLVLLFGSWEWRYLPLPLPLPLPQQQEIVLNTKAQTPPHDYGDRTQLSAFILCLFVGFSGAHHFYMKRYITGLLQLSFLIMTICFYGLGMLALFALFGILLFAWVLADTLLLCFRGILPKSNRPLIPWD